MQKLLFRIGHCAFRLLPLGAIVGALLINSPGLSIGSGSAIQPERAPIFTDQAVIETHRFSGLSPIRCLPLLQGTQPPDRGPSGGKRMRRRDAVAAILAG